MTNEEKTALISRYGVKGECVTVGLWENSKDSSAKFYLQILLRENGSCTTFQSNSMPLPPFGYNDTTKFFIDYSQLYKY